MFPNDVRQFVQAGAEVILNLSNDYWSLTETEGMQHAANAVFRAVENGRPLARAAASGPDLPGGPRGADRGASPFYRESLLVVDVPLSDHADNALHRLGRLVSRRPRGGPLLILLGWSMLRRAAR